MIKGIVFDLDGTLIDSPLSLNDIRVELKIPPKTPILEYICHLSIEEQKIAQKVVLSHELRAAEDAILQPGIELILNNLAKRGIEIGLFTRNCKAATMRILERLKLEFNDVVTRDCAPPKPDPTGLIQIIKNWGIDLSHAVYLGDYLFDIQVGKNAGVKTALYLPQGNPDYAQQADFVFTDYSDFEKIVLST